MEDGRKAERLRESIAAWVALQQSQSHPRNNPQREKVIQSGIHIRRDHVHHQSSLLRSKGRSEHGRRAWKSRFDHNNNYKSGTPQRSTASRFRIKTNSQTPKLQSNLRISISPKVARFLWFSDKLRWSKRRPVFTWNGGSSTGLYKWRRQHNICKS